MSDLDERPSTRQVYQNQWNIPANEQKNFILRNNGPFFKNTSSDKEEFSQERCILSSKKPLRKVLFKKKYFLNSTNDASKTSSPKSMPYEKEHYYDEIIQLKQQLNRIQNEKSLLKTKFQFLCLKQKEEIQKLLRNSLGKPQQCIYNNFSNEEQDNLQSSQITLISELKKQNKELRQKIDMKEQMIDILNRTQKVHKYRELEIELEQYRSETNRFKNMLLQSMIIDKRFECSDNLKEVSHLIRKDNIEMAAIIEELEQHVTQTKQALKKEQHKNWQVTNIVNISKKQVLMQKKELEQLKNNNPYQLMKNKHPTLVDELNEEIQYQQYYKNKRKKIQEIFNLTQTLQAKEWKINDLDRKLKDLSAELQDKVSRLEKERNSLKDRLTQKNEEVNFYVQSQRDKGGRRSTIVKDYRQSFVTQESNLPSLTQELNSDSDQSEEENKDPLIKQSTVLKKDVINIGNVLKYHLRKQKIPMKDIDRYLFDQKETQEEQNTICLHQLNDQLQKFPFNLANDESLKISRYLIENTDEKKVVVKMDASSSVPRVRSIFRNLLGNYELFDDEKNLINEITPYIKKFKNSIKDFIDRLDGPASKISCSVDDFMDALAHIDLSLSSRQMDFILQKNYELDGNSQDFKYADIIQMLL